ncbi:quinoprotein dehydrogenase-associated SoxYZ-like carrier [Thiorhodococcus minor]|uniref:Quinoprotein dehydrogenase-associated SoxYZ-like carrier n=1 Tax=Thiorhodococcus minor TaxID=57489 RepID=A0A6M0K407_9GAMM|nr:quinoprotein dehydrogenase-associated SoxYZ-like carrier [Thiorhodococcus minor]NEV63653.1 quinoprotein dehydrogenase-associated SoxYZ-like carrier [Thiorhodococcus minor]
MKIVSKPGQADWRLRSLAGLFAFALLMLLGAAVAVAESEAQDDSRWPVIKSALFGEREILPGEGVIALETPYRALDAAVVPIEITAPLAQTPERYIESLHLVIDNNPVPLAGVFHFPGNRTWDALSTRIRVDSYTHVRAIAETNDGKLYMARNFVKASGGCSAPSLKDPEAAQAQLGRMKLRLPETLTSEQTLPLQLMIKHPNSSGLQFDQIARSYIPADYIQRLELTYGGEPLLTLDGNISISEDPSIRFSFAPGDASRITVHAEDSTGRHFEQTFDLPAPKGG